MDPAMFSVANMFDAESGEDEDDAFVERNHNFPGLVLRIREFAFHQVNANLLWPGAVVFAEWIAGHEELVRRRRVLELGSGTGALAIFLKRRLNLDITTCDYDDAMIEDNIKHNGLLNGVGNLPHIRHTWGEDFPLVNPDWDLIIASDILLYVKQYTNLIRTLSFLFKGSNLESKSLDLKQPSMPNSPISLSGQASLDGKAIGEIQVANQSLTLAQPMCLPRPSFLMSWRRRIPKEDEALFFEGCRSAGFVVMDLGSRIYCIHPAV